MKAVANPPTHRPDPRGGAVPDVERWVDTRRREVVSVKHPESGDTPILITDAASSYQDELATRRRRYSIMMALRVPCLVLAALFYQTPWLAASLIILSIPLPWIAVIIANDRLPLKRSTFRRYQHEVEGRQLASPPDRGESRNDGHQIIDQ